MKASIIASGSTFHQNQSPGRLLSMQSPLGIRRMGRIWAEPIKEAAVRLCPGRKDTRSMAAVGPKSIAAQLLDRRRPRPANTWPHWKPSCRLCRPGRGEPVSGVGLGSKVDRLSVESYGSALCVTAILEWTQDERLDTTLRVRNLQSPLPRP